MKILLVDDDHEDRQAFTETLEKLNIPLTGMIYAHDSKELFSHLDNHPDTNLIWLDINMPFKDGKQCLKEIKANEKFRHIPVVMYTVSLSEKDIDDTYQYGAHYYVVKPYAPSNFLLTLQTVFDVNWMQVQPVPAKEHFVINYTYSK